VPPGRATTHPDRCRLSACRGAPIVVQEPPRRRPPLSTSSIARRCAGSPRTAPRREVCSTSCPHATSPK
jgi:hypothetical protein